MISVDRGYRLPIASPTFITVNYTYNVCTNEIVPFLREEGRFSALVICSCWDS